MNPRETAEQCFRFLEQLHDLCDMVPDAKLGDAGTVMDLVAVQAASTSLVAIPSRSDIASIRAWVTAALPVVEAVQELQEAAGVRVHGPWMEANEAFRLARNKVLAVACPVSK